MVHIPETKDGLNNTL